MINLLSAIGLVFVIEGCVLALFTEYTKKAIVHILSLADNHLKIAGIVSAIFGLAIVSIAQGL